MRRNKFVGWRRTRDLALIMAAILVFTGYLSYIFVEYSLSAIQWTFSIALAILSIGIAVHSIVISKQSDLKMTALTNLNFVEKHAAMQYRKAEFNAGNFTLLNACKLDFEAAMELKDWLDEDRKKEYIDDLIKLIRETKIALKGDIQGADKKTVKGTLKTMIDKALKSELPTKPQTEELTELRQQLSKSKS